MSGDSPHPHPPPPPSPAPAPPLSRAVSSESAAKDVVSGVTTRGTGPPRERQKAQGRGRNGERDGGGKEGGRVVRFNIHFPRASPDNARYRGGIGPIIRPYE